MKRCADFDVLAPIIELDASLLRRDSPADAFIVAMALAYNDYKDVNWMLERLADGQPDELYVVSPYHGQWHGMMSHVKRNILAILHEVLKAIDTARLDSVLADPHLKAAIRHLPLSARRRWKALVELSQGGKTKDPIHNFLVRVRNNVTSHYYQPDALMKGYEDFFVAAERTPANAVAMYSVSGTMKASRFYFADAAATQATDEVLSNAQFAQVNKYLRHLNIALLTLVTAYLKVKRSVALQGKPRRSRRTNR